MAFKVGAKIIYITQDDNMNSFIKEGTVTKVKNSMEMWIDNRHKTEDCLYQSFAYPDIPECRQFLQAGIDMRKRYKAEEDEYMKQMHILNNQLVRKGLK